MWTLVAVVMLPVLLTGAVMVLQARKGAKDYENNVAAAKAKTGWVPDKAIYVDDDCYMAAIWEIRDGALVLSRRHVTYYPAGIYGLPPFARSETVKVFAPGQWKTVSFEDGVADTKS